MFKSKNRKLAFIAFSTTSLTYSGFSTPSQCIENHVSANLDPATSSSFCCRIRGVALAQFRVLLLLILVLSGRTSFDPASKPSFPFALSNICRLRGGAWRSLEDLECSSFLSRSASDLVGLLKAFGKDSSSIVFVCSDFADRESVRLRNEMPSRCRNFRFCRKQLRVRNC